MNGPLKKPTILILDEFDALPAPELAQTIATFRQLYLEREKSRLHGLALIGVHSVLGDVTSTMSPFNVQRSVNIPNLTRDEVFSLYAQYTAESGQHIEPEGIERIYDMFRGQPGLTCWFGELLTEKRNQVQPPPWERKEGPPPEGYPLITRKRVDMVIELAQFSEINVNIMNLISKGMAHRELLCSLFVNHSMQFNLNKPELQWLYLNGILVGESESETSGREVCAFASPFVQVCLFSAFGDALNTAYNRAELTLASEGKEIGQARAGLDIPLLLTLYRRFLGRLVAKGSAPWVDQPSRSDARAFEAIGHFNLYAWLFNVAKAGFAVVPEFPTGNGTADLLLTNTRMGLAEVLEIKSFTNTSDLEKAVEQAARYARKLKLMRSYLVVMADASAYAVLHTAPAQHEALGVTVCLEVIPWGFWPGQTPLVAVPAAAVARSGTLTMPDRLALAHLVLPQLTPLLLREMQVQLHFPVQKVPKRELPFHWQALVAECEARGLLADLGLMLAFLFPDLQNHSVIERLRPG